MAPNAPMQIYRLGTPKGLRVLVLEASLFLLSEHIQHLARIGLKVPSDAIDTFDELPEFRRHDPEVL